MMRTFIVALLLVLLAPACLAIDPTTLPDPVLQERYTRLTHEFRCVKCVQQTVADSPGEVSEDLRRQVREMLVAGKTDDEIRDFMVARYGEFILFKPRYSARNMWLWLLPSVLLIGGGIIAFRIVRQRSALVAQDDQPVDEDTVR